MMTVLVTGANGFIGKNLVIALENLSDIQIIKFDVINVEEELNDIVDNVDFVFHLAGINRPQDTRDFMRGNFGLTCRLLESLKKHNNKAPVLITSSVQASLDNPYGQSKKAAEDLLFQYQRETGAKVLIYRLPNVFGKWCRPNYNSAVATFCHNIANGLPITVNDADVTMNLVYIDDVVNEFIRRFKNEVGANKFDTPVPAEYYAVAPVHTIKLYEIVNLLYSFKDGRKDLYIPDMSDGFIKKLNSTYTSYLPIEQFSYPLMMHTDNRGSFTEIMKTLDRGQVSVNVSKPGITKGNHWHHSKCEKFLVVYGRGVIRFRRIDLDNVLEYFVGGDKLEVVDIPPGYTHNIENLGETDMVTIIWANEPFNPDKPDTIFLEV
jgi:UDP-2-acetamido-2,6-beta-L-arabino-hexul-4-ose reductase